MTTTLEKPMPVAPGAAGPRLAAGETAVIALSSFVLHVAAILVTPYSVHRDELLYLAMGKYLSLFAMDFPPFIALAANASVFVFGESLFAIRILPAVAGAAIVAMTALAARELGGGRAAQVLAMLCVLSAPLFMRAAALFQPVVFDQLWWTLALLALLRVRQRGAVRDWILLGVAGGVGLLTKFSIGFIAVGILAGLLFTDGRRTLTTRWPYVAAVIALVIGSPSILGQISLGVPVAGQMSDLQTTQLDYVSPASFLSGQVFMMGPAVLLALAGLYALLLSRSLRTYRAAGIACATAVLLLLVLRGKPYYAGPVYPLLLAAGATAVMTAQRMRRTLFVTASLASLAYGFITLPLGLPVLPPEQMARYAGWLGIGAATRTNQGEQLALPQDYADMLGWEEQVEAVARAYGSLSPSERERAVIIAGNYGEAGAIDWFGRRHGLPRAIAPIGSYWFFGPGELPGEIAITLGLEPEDLDGFYAQFEVVERVVNPWGVPEQQDNPVGVARGPFRTVQDVWPDLAGRN